MTQTGIQTLYPTHLLKYLNNRVIKSVLQTVFLLRYPSDLVKKVSAMPGFLDTEWESPLSQLWLFSLIEYAMGMAQ